MDYLENPNEYTEWLIKSGLPGKFKKKFILKNYQCPGDLLMLSACVRDIKIWYPDIDLDVQSSDDAIWENNPNLTQLDSEDPDVVEIDCQYEIIHQSNENIHAHFIHGFIEDFNRKTGLAVKLTSFKPDIHLTDEEKETPVFDDLPEKFVVLLAGGKKDYQTKWWKKEGWESVVNRCSDITFVQIGKVENDHIHNEISSKNCISKVGQTNTREMMRLVYQSVGTLSVVTAAMHMAAAFDKHAAVIAGGHEPWWWEKYPGHDYFHSIGRLNCCRFGGCWKKECENKNEDGNQKCLELIDPKEVAQRIKGWF